MAVKFVFFIFLLIFYVKSSCSVVLNVLYLTIDDLRPILGSYGAEGLTPEVNKLCNSGTMFLNAYAQLALCAPSRVSFLTSRRPDTTKLYDFYSYWRNVAGNFTTLPQYLKEHGYDTYSIGKVFHPGESSNFTDDYPYSWSEPPWHPPSDMYKDVPECLNNGALNDNLVCPVDLKKLGHSLPDIESTEKALSFLKSRKGVGRPFFLGLGYHKPHVPLKYPEEYRNLYPIDEISLPAVRTKPRGMPEVAWNPYNDLRERHDVKSLNVSFPYGPIPDTFAKLIKQSYLAAVSYVDKLVGQVLTGLRESGLENNTVVVLLGDHGWSLGEHGEWAKFSNFDVALKVPLIIKVPNLTSGLKVKTPVELVDLFPTVIDILGLPSIARCQSRREILCTEGKSAASLLVQDKFEERPVFGQYPRPGVYPTIKPNTDRPRLEEIKVMGYTVKTSRYRFTLWVSWRPFRPNWTDIKGIELYDHFTDSFENLNLAGKPKFQKVQESLTLLLKSHFSHEKSI